MESNAENAQRKYAVKHFEFRAAVIEPLPDDGVFEIETPAGTFRMTKAEFHSTFPEIVRSVSYRDQGAYHYPKLPYKVFRFLVREKKTATAPDLQNVAGDAGVDQIQGPDPERSE